jgi:FimV-like protein
MSNEQLKHIFDDSVCLTKRQMKDYVSGVMTNEEAHAVELHLNSCPFCSDAIEGMLSIDKDDALHALHEINGNFLLEHLGNTQPQKQQPYHTITDTTPAKRSIPLWRAVSIAAALLLFFGLLWYNKSDTTTGQNTQLAQEVVEPGDKATASHNPIASDADVAARPAATGEQKIAAVRAAKPESFLNEEPGKQASGAIAYDVQAAAPAAVPEPAAVQEAEKKEQPKEVEVLAYKVPLIDKYAPGAKSTATEDKIEKMSTRSVQQDVAATAPNIDRRLGNSAYEREAEEPAKAVVARKKDNAIQEEADQPDNIYTGNKLFAQKRYSNAITTFQKEFSSTNKGRRHEAMIMAARSYINLGNKTKATQLLQNIIEEGGPQKRSAKKLLKEVNAEQK